MFPSARVLPWRRHSESLHGEFASLLETFHHHYPDEDTTALHRAFEIAETAHHGQTRKSGEAYIHHPVAVARLVADLGFDATSVMAAMLHDALEDTLVTRDELVAEFGEDLAMIVDGVTKLDRVHFDSKEEQQSASMRKMMVAIAQDVRVLIIKLADRLHNLRTIAALPEWKQERTARETLDVYAPLANRMGMNLMKQQLEDLSFSALHPKRFSEIDQMVTERDPERDIFLQQVLGAVEHELEKLGIEAAVFGRPKHLWSIYEKMVVRGRSFDDIYDLVGIRVVVPSVRDCYSALGSIHAMWNPVPGRFKDYIAMPKFNLYQSLHTTVVGPSGRPLEIQIRTREMNDRAESGIAAHWKYKGQDQLDDKGWLNRILDYEEDSDGAVYMDNLRVDLDPDEVYVFTPDGEVITLPVGATTVDMAYAVHTEVGHSCIGARVNNKLVPIETRLTSGDTVEVVTSKNVEAGPSRDWLTFVVSHRASSKIRQWFLRERREDALVNGRDDMSRAIRRAGLPVQKMLGSDLLLEVATAMNFADLDHLYGAVGEGHVTAKAVVEKLKRQLEEPDGATSEQLPTTAIQPRHHRRTANVVGVHVEGLPDVMVRLAQCCAPVPPDEIMGFVTMGRGVSVHRADCTNADSLLTQTERLIDVDWDLAHGAEFVSCIEVKALDRSYLLNDLTGVLSESQINICGASSETGADRVARFRFEIEVGDISQLNDTLRRLRSVDGVYEVYRTMGSNIRS